MQKLALLFSFSIIMSAGLNILPITFSGLSPLFSSIDGLDRTNSQGLLQTEMLLYGGVISCFTHFYRSFFTT